MYDKLCRNCGIELTIQSSCSQCLLAICQICRNCGYATFEQIHNDCTIGFEVIQPTSVQTTIMT